MSGWFGSLGFVVMYCGRVDFRVFDCWLRLLWCLCGLIVTGFVPGFGGSCGIGLCYLVVRRFVCYVRYWRARAFRGSVALMFLAGFVSVCALN